LSGQDQSLRYRHFDSSVTNGELFNEIEGMGTTLLITGPTLAASRVATDPWRKAMLYRWVLISNGKHG